MKQLWKLIKTWARILTIKVLGLFPKVKGTTIQAIGNAWKEQDRVSEQIIRDLKANGVIYKIANALKWFILIIIGGIITYIVLKIINLIKNR